jgi:hypothetical protein
MTTSKATQRPQMFTFHVRQPPFLSSLQSNVCDIRGWNYPKFMHESNIYLMLVTSLLFHLRECGFLSLHG